MGKALNNTIYYTIGAIVKAMASFLLLPLFTNILGAAQYGILNLLQTFSTILATVMTLAVERSLYRLYYDYHTNEEQSRFLSSVFWLICINSIFVIGLTILLGEYISPYLGNVDVYSILLPVVFYTFLSAIINFSQIIMQVEQNGKQFLVISLLILVIYNLLALLLIYYYLPTVRSMVYASFSTFFLVAPISFYRIRKRIQFIIDKQCVCDVFNFSFSILVMVIFAWVLQFSDRLFIANMSSYENVGIYSLAVKVVSIIHLFAGAIFQAYGPYFYSVVNTMPETEAKQKLKGINSSIIFIICSLGIIIILFSKSLLSLFFSNEYSFALIFIYFLSVSMIFSQQTGILNLMILQNKKTTSYSLITILGGVLSIALNTLFIPVYGAVFAAVSNLIVSIVMVILMYKLAKKNYYIDFDFHIFIYSLILIPICALCDIFLKNHWMSLLIKLLILAIWFCIGLKIKIVRLGNMVMIKQTILNKIKLL